MFSTLNTFILLFTLVLILGSVTFSTPQQEDENETKEDDDDDDNDDSREPKPLEMFKQSRLCPDQTNDLGAPYRFYRPTKKCYLVGKRGPCGELMTFTLLNDEYGYCDCDQNFRCGRPLLFWSQTKRCYYVNDQGPCSPGKWLVFGFNLHAVCRKNPCVAKQTTLPSRGTHSYWFEHKGQCYRTGTQGYCANTTRQILLNDWDKHRPSCSDNEAPECEITQFPVMKCLPGMKLDYYEQCTLKLNRKRPESTQVESSDGVPAVSNTNTIIDQDQYVRGPNIYSIKLE